MSKIFSRMEASIMVFNYFNKYQKKRMLRKIQESFEQNHPEVLALWKSYGIPVD